MKLFSAIFFFTTFYCSALFAQSSKINYPGTLTGIVKDSVHNYALENTTLAIYRKADSSLVGYQLANNFGEFAFGKLPVDELLFLKATLVGYKTATHTFTIPSATKKLDLKVMYLDKVVNALDEVVIKADPPPIRMRGDTLEFNAAAFKLDTNAVVEDLLKRLPGVEVWSDGLITVNGKAIKEVLVENKPFFGGDAKTAIQNLPKNSVEKIQVYKDVSDDDSKEADTKLNIVLKKNKKDGFFGKIEGGAGTDQRYDAVGLINYFDPKTQISLGGSLNNVNKTPYNIKGLLGYTSYKGDGVTSAYSADFNRRGTNISRSIGLDLEHIPQKGKTIKANYFMNDISSLNTQDLLTTFSLGNNAEVKKSNDRRSEEKGYNHTTGISYENKGQYANTYAEANYSAGERSQFDIVNEVTNNSATNRSATYMSNNNGTYTSEQVNLKAGYSGTELARINRPWQTFNLDYAFNASNNLSDRTRVNATRDEQLTLLNSFNRNYNERNRSNNHYLGISKNNFLRGWLSNFFQLSINNGLDIYNNSKNYLTEDLDTNLNRYVRSDNLSYDANYRVINERAGLEVNKSFVNNLANRYSRVFSVILLAKGQLYDQRNTSTLAFQNLHRKYTKFIPSASITYRDIKYQGRDNTYSITYNTEAVYPQMDQLAPLVDEADGFYLNYGNIRLRPSYKHELSLRFFHSNANAGNFIYSANLRAGIVKDHMTDSTLYDTLGRVVHYTVNIDRQHYARLSGQFLKSFRFKENAIQLAYLGNIGFYRNPIYVDTKYILSNVWSSDNSLDITYNLKSWLALRVVQSLQTFRSTREGIVKTEFNNVITNTAFVTNILWSKHWTLASNINFNKNSSPGRETINYTIWNANLSYRFLKGQNAEVKFSAMDILRQNTGVIISGSPNSITRGTTNVLRQYYMVSLSYFPRKFGLSNKAK